MHVCCCYSINCIVYCNRASYIDSLVLLAHLGLHKTEVSSGGRQGGVEQNCDDPDLYYANKITSVIILQLYHCNSIANDDNNRILLCTDTE